jgi:hypothetical protein
MSVVSSNVSLCGERQESEHGLLEDLLIQQLEGEFTCGETAMGHRVHGCLCGQSLGATSEIHLGIILTAQHLHLEGKHMWARRPGDQQPETHSSQRQTGLDPPPGETGSGTLLPTLIAAGRAVHMYTACVHLCVHACGIACTLGEIRSKGSWGLSVGREVWISHLSGQRQVRVWGGLWSAALGG